MKNLAQGFNTAAQDLAANHPDPVRILDVGTMTSPSHLKLQSKMLVDAYLLHCFPGSVTISLCTSSTTVSRMARRCGFSGERKY